MADRTMQRRNGSRTKWVTAVGVATLSSSAAMAGNLVINGDFEDNSAFGPEVNLTNAEFNNFVPNANAFGTSMELDLTTNGFLGILSQSGEWHVGLHQRPSDPNNVDAFSLELSEALLMGGSYDLQFFAARQVGSEFGPVEIGLSTDPGDFGTLIYSGTPTSSNDWTQFDFNFAAPFAATHLTVRNTTEPDMYAFVDNFQLTAVPAPSVFGVLLAGGLLSRGGLRRRL